MTVCGATETLTLTFCIPRELKEWSKPTLTNSIKTCLGQNYISRNVDIEPFVDLYLSAHKIKVESEKLNNELFFKKRTLMVFLHDVQVKMGAHLYTLQSCVDISHRLPTIESHDLSMVSSTSQLWFGKLKDNVIRCGNILHNIVLKKNTQYAFTMLKMYNAMDIVVKKTEKILVLLDTSNQVMLNERERLIVLLD